MLPVIELFENNLNSLFFNAFRKNLVAAFLSRFAVNRNSTVLPSLSTAL